MRKPLLSAGVKARLWQVQPEEYDMIPVRWYPRPEDQSRMEQVAAGRLIGARQHLAPRLPAVGRLVHPALGAVVPEVAGGAGIHGVAAARIDEDA